MTHDHSATLRKRATGIQGLDTVTRGGLPAAGAVLVLGEAGAGKTVLALNILARALERGEAGVFVTFEETRHQILRDAASFTWGTILQESSRWELVDAGLPPDTVAAGGFDLGALLAAINASAERTDAAWVVLDGIDQLLRLHPEPEKAMRQITELDRWCEERQITLLLTGKYTGKQDVEPDFLPGIEFMLSTVIVLSAELVGRRLNRRFRILKYRGTGHATDELAMIVDADGVHLPYDETGAPTVEASSARVGTGIGRLDRLLDGGIYQGSTLLISGAPGTAKSTLCANFTLAAAERGERVVYLSFDELADRIVRNVASVGIELAPYIESGQIALCSREAWSGLVEEHYIAIQELLAQHDPQCLVVDPISALLKASSAEHAQLATERLLDQARRRGITTVLTSLVESHALAEEATKSHVSTLADTWITLDYKIQGGERNRAVSIVKSRGTAHSNQVRELVLSADGIDLADVYEFGSEVLMGTARIQKEAEETARIRRERHEREQRRRDLERKLEHARTRIEDAQQEAERLQQELERELEDARQAEQEAAEHHVDVARRRDPGTATETGSDES